jgi:hypothetical protein
MCSFSRDQTLQSIVLSPSLASNDIEATSALHHPTYVAKSSPLLAICTWPVHGRCDETIPHPTSNTTCAGTDDTKTRIANTRTETKLAGDAMDLLYESMDGQ